MRACAFILITVVELKTTIWSWKRAYGVRRLTLSSDAGEDGSVPMLVR